MSPSTAIGFGCSSRASAKDILHLIRGCVPEIAPGSVVATLDRHAAIGNRVAESLGLQLMVFPAAVLAQMRGITRHSPAALAAVGTPSVAEAAALAALGPGARLMQERRAGHYCTCAVAVIQ